MKYLFTSTLIILASTIFSQVINYGPEFKNKVTPSAMNIKTEKTGGVYKFIGELNNKIYAIDKRCKYLYVFNPVTKLMISRNVIEISPEHNFGKIHIPQTINILNNKLILISNCYNRSSKERKVVSFELDKRGKSVESFVLLDYVRVNSKNSKTPKPMMNLETGLIGYIEPSKSQTDSLQIIFSSDSTKFLVGYSFYNKSEESYEATVATFDFTLKALTKKTLVKSMYSNKKYLNQCNYLYYISNKGEWTACSRVWNIGVQPEISKETQCLECKGFDIKGEIKRKSNLFLDNSLHIMPEFLMSTSGSFDSIVMFGKSYDNSKRKIKIDDEFMGAFQENVISTGIFSLPVFKPNISKRDIVNINFVANFKMGHSEFDFAVDPILYSNGFIIVAESSKLFGRLSGYQYVLYIDKMGKLNSIYDFVTQTNYGYTLPVSHSNIGGYYSELGFSYLNKNYDKPLVRSLNSTGEIEYIIYDILERDINSSELFEINRKNIKELKMGLVRITVDDLGSKTRTVIDNGEIDFLVCPGINYISNMGDIQMLGVLGETGKLVTITP
jgi:hypothetical protein